jgi:hypothetical protein
MVFMAPPLYHKDEIYCSAICHVSGFPNPETGARQPQGQIGTNEATIKQIPINGTKRMKNAA